LTDIIVCLLLNYQSREHFLIGDRMRKYHNDKRQNIVLFLIIVISLISIIGYISWTTKKSVVSRSDLGFIREGISYDIVVSQIGEPNRDVGSGVYLFEYELDDGGLLILGFSNLDYLNQASILEKDGTSISLLR